MSYEAALFGYQKCEFSNGPWTRFVYRRGRGLSKIGLQIGLQLPTAAEHPSQLRCGQAIVPERIAHAREPSKLPVVLSADEVVHLLWRRSRASRAAPR